MGSERGESCTPTLASSPPDLPQGSDRGSDQIFQLVGLTAWRVALWIQKRNPVEMRGQVGGKLRGWGTPLQPDWRARDPGRGLELEAGSAQTRGRGFGKLEEAVRAWNA